MTPELIAKIALQEIGQLAVGDDPPAEDRDYCVRKLDYILLLLRKKGVMWSTRKSANIAYGAGSGTVTMVTNYKGAPKFCLIEPDGSETPMGVLTPQQWESIPQKLETGVPAYMHKDGDGTWHIYPVPEINGTVKAYYDSTISKTSPNTAIGLDDEWEPVLVKGVAYEISGLYEVTEQRRKELKKEFDDGRDMLIANDVPEGAIRIDVDDAPEILPYSGGGSPLDSVLEID